MGGKSVKHDPDSVRAAIVHIVNNPNLYWFRSQEYSVIARNSGATLDWMLSQDVIIVELKTYEGFLLEQRIVAFMQPDDHDLKRLYSSRRKAIIGIDDSIPRGEVESFLTGLFDDVKSKSSEWSFVGGYNPSCHKGSTEIKIEAGHVWVTRYGKTSGYDMETNFGDYINMMARSSGNRRSFWRRLISE